MSTKARTAKALALTVLRPVEPGYLILYVNNVCNLRCHMCLVWDQMQVKTNDLSLAEHIELSKSFRNLLQLTVTGGEPLLREDERRKGVRGEKEEKEEKRGEKVSEEKRCQE